MAPAPAPASDPADPVDESVEGSCRLAAAAAAAEDEPVLPLTTAPTPIDESLLLGELKDPDPLQKSEHMLK